MKDYMPVIIIIMFISASTGPVKEAKGSLFAQV
jgi:hypothetical protein